MVGIGADLRHVPYPETCIFFGVVSNLSPRWFISRCMTRLLSALSELQWPNIPIGWCMLMPPLERNGHILRYCYFALFLFTWLITYWSLIQLYWKGLWHHLNKDACTRARTLRTPWRWLVLSSKDRTSFIINQFWNFRTFFLLACRKKQWEFQNWLMMKLIPSFKLKTNHL